MRKPSSQPALLSLPRRALARFQPGQGAAASFRRSARFPAQCPFPVPRLGRVAGYIQHLNAAGSQCSGTTQLGRSAAPAALSKYRCVSGLLNTADFPNAGPQRLEPALQLRHRSGKPLPQLRQVSANHIPQFYALQAAPTPSSEFSSMASPGNRSGRRRRAAPGDRRSRTARLRWIGAPSPITGGLPNIASGGCCRNQTTSSL